MKIIHQLAFIALAGILILTGFKSPVMSKSGCLYMQTNGIKNELIHYTRMEDGDLVEKQGIATGGAGSGTYKPISDQARAGVKT